MGVLLALASSVAYGIADFAGGLLSRRAAFLAVALAGQVSGLAVTLAVAPFVPAHAVSTADLGWGALSGAGTAVGMLFLYRGLSRGAMSVVVPVSAVGGLALPVLVGVAFLGDRLTLLAWAGVALSVPAMWCVAGARRGPAADPASPSTSSASTASADGLIASLGIALQYLALAQAGAGAGIWPVVAGRLAAVLTLLPLTLPPRARRNGALRLPPRLALAAAAPGAAAALALVCYLLATRQQLASIAVVLSSLYPAIPVLLGVLALGERLSLPQRLGLLGAGTAIACLTLG